MGIRFACHLCGRPLHIKAELAGKIGRCPACQQRFRIPREDTETSLPVAPQRSPADDPQTTKPHSDAPNLTEPLQWFVHQPSHDQPYGPADESLIRTWIAQKRINGQTLVWRSDWPDWRVAGDYFIELAGDTSQHSPPSSPRPAASPASGDVATSTPQPGPPFSSTVPPSTNPTLRGDASLGRQRIERVRRRLAWVVGLAVTCLLLLIVLGVLLAR